MFSKIKPDISDADEGVTSHSVSILFWFAQCTTLTLEDESQASTTALTPSAPASLPCICLMTEREALSIFRSLPRRTPPTNTPTSSIPTTRLLRTKPPSTQTASSMWTSVGTDPDSCTSCTYPRCRLVFISSLFRYPQDTAGSPWCRARWTPW